MGNIGKFLYFYWSVILLGGMIIFVVSTFIYFMVDGSGVREERIQEREDYKVQKENECKEVCSPDKYFFSMSNSYQIVTCECG